MKLKSLRVLPLQCSASSSDAETLRKLTALGEQGSAAAGA